MALNVVFSPRVVHRGVQHLQPPIHDYLLPSFQRASHYGQRALITTSSSSPSSEPKPQALFKKPKTSRRRPLSKEQQQFLDSAVSDTAKTSFPHAHISF